MTVGEIRRCLGLNENSEAIELNYNIQARPAFIESCLTELSLKHLMNEELTNLEKLGFDVILKSAGLNNL